MQKIKDEKKTSICSKPVDGMAVDTKLYTSKTFRVNEYELARLLAQPFNV